MKYVVMATLLLAAAPATAQTMETSSGDWSNIPVMRQQVGVGVDPDVVAAIAEMVDRRECTIPGQRRGNLDMSVPFLVQFQADGSIGRIVIHAVGCARAEGLLAGAALRMMRQRAFEPSGGPHEGWFRGELSFAHSDG